MFAHEHESLLPAALVQKGCKVNHFFVPDKILSKFYQIILSDNPQKNLITLYQNTTNHSAYLSKRVQRYRLFTKQPNKKRKNI
jgi:hypothetical protein